MVGLTLPSSVSLRSIPSIWWCWWRADGLRVYRGAECLTPAPITLASGTEAWGLVQTELAKSGFRVDRDEWSIVASAEVSLVAYGESSQSLIGASLAFSCENQWPIAAEDFVANGEYSSPFWVAVGVPKQELDSFLGSCDEAGWSPRYLLSEGWLVVSSLRQLRRLPENCVCRLRDEWVVLQNGMVRQFLSGAAYHNNEGQILRTMRLQGIGGPAILLSTLDSTSPDIMRLFEQTLALDVEQEIPYALSRPALIKSLPNLRTQDWQEPQAWRRTVSRLRGPMWMLTLGMLALAGIAEWVRVPLDRALADQTRQQVEAFQLVLPGKTPPLAIQRRLESELQSRQNQFSVAATDLRSATPVLSTSWSALAQIEEPIWVTEMHLTADKLSIVASSPRFEAAAAVHRELQRRGLQAALPVTEQSPDQSVRLRFQAGFPLANRRSP